MVCVCVCGVCVFVGKRENMNSKLFIIMISISTQSCKLFHFFMIISRSTQNYKLVYFIMIIFPGALKTINYFIMITSRSTQNYKLFHFIISRSWVVTPLGWSRHFRNLWDLWISWTVALRTSNPWSTSHSCMPTLCVSRLGNWTGKKTPFVLVLFCFSCF